MAGHTSDCELKATRRTSFAIASESDDAAIRRMLRDTAMPGAVKLTFEREPSYFAGADIAGAKDLTIVAKSRGRLICVGRCSRRVCWVNKRETDVGYLAELRLDSSARGQFSIIREGYEYFHKVERSCPADVYFTSIASDNERARRFLERGVRGMPVYSFLSELVTLLIAMPRRPSATRFRMESATADRIPEMLRMLNGSGSGRQLSAVWSRETLLDLDHHGLPLNRFLLIRDGEDLVGCGALWDQRSFRQIVIRGYGPMLALARPFVNCISSVLGTPQLPTVGSSLPHAFLSPIAIRPGAEELLADVVEAFFPLARRLGFEFVTIGLPARDVRIAKLRKRFSVRTWASRLYRVSWEDSNWCELSQGNGPYLPDVAFL